MTAQPNDLTNRVVAGSYRVESKLGTGGMGTVWRAIDIRLDRPVALKVVKAELRNNPSFIERFEREARAAAKVRHEGLVEIHAAGEDNELGLLYLALELVEGQRL